MQNQLALPIAVFVFFGSCILLMAEPEWTVTEPETGWDYAYNAEIQTEGIAPLNTEIRIRLEYMNNPQANCEGGNMVIGASHDMQNGQDVDWDHDFPAPTVGGWAVSDCWCAKLYKKESPLQPCYAAECYRIEGPVE